MDNFNNQPTNPSQFDEIPFGMPINIKVRDRASSDMRYVEYIRSHGYPPAPLFKPQIAPSDALGEMQLPPSELADKEDRKVLSTQSGLKLVEEEEDAMDEEEENDRFEVPEKPSAAKSILSTQEHTPPKMEKVFKSPTRFRSRSENLNNGSIFKFMENTVISRKEQGKMNCLF